MPTSSKCLILKWLEVLFEPVDEESTLEDGHDVGWPWKIIFLDRRGQGGLIQKRRALDYVGGDGR